MINTTCSHARKYDTNAWAGLGHDGHVSLFVVPDTAI
jgi:hypothetical protein